MDKKDKEYINNVKQIIFKEEEGRGGKEQQPKENTGMQRIVEIKV